MLWLSNYQYVMEIDNQHRIAKGLKEEYLKRINDQKQRAIESMFEPVPYCDKPLPPIQKEKAHNPRPCSLTKHIVTCSFIQDKETLKLESMRYSVLSLCD